MKRNNIAKYEAVNACETLEELAEVIMSFADDNGEIKGRERFFSASKMALFCKNFTPSGASYLTREWGIRQQALYIDHYSPKVKVEDYSFDKPKKTT